MKLLIFLRANDNNELLIENRNLFFCIFLLLFGK